MAMKLGNVSLACKRMGFSRRFYYRWYKRLKRSGWNIEALEERSRRPKRSPLKILASLETGIRWYARRQYGARMIKAYLAREGLLVGKTTICHVLNKRQKPEKKRRERLKKHRKRYELAIPGQRLQMDVKYVPELVNGRRAYCYVAVDECTRWRFAYAFDNLCAGTTVVFLDKLKAACPFPIATIQTDNGIEFTYSLNAVMKDQQHPMDQWCKVNGINHRLIPPGVKELNGKVERSHRIDEQYFYWKAPTKSLQLLNMALAKWMGEYNGKRLHGGLGYRTPLEKLAERTEALKTETVEPQLESIRVKFLSHQPKPKESNNPDRQLQQLHKTLKALLNAA